MSKKIRYQGETLTVLFDPKRCIHAAECVHGRREVFDPDRRPWVKPDAGPVGLVTDIVTRCPTGALTYERVDGEPGETAPVVNSIQVLTDGPISVQGNLELEFADGRVQAEMRVALCRCGASQNKPYCDNSHLETGFEDPGAIGESKLPSSAARGKLLIKVLSDGPILLDGAYRLLDASGKICNEAARGHLCRCGASANRPFCDGGHRKLGFKDPE